MVQSVQTIRDSYGRWMFNGWLLRGLFVKTSNGILVPATASRILKGKILRRANGAAVLFTSNGQFSKKVIHVDYYLSEKTKKEEPYQLSLNDDELAYRV